jgi:hypothetical protein
MGFWGSDPSNYTKAKMRKGKLRTIIGATKGLIGKMCWGVDWERQLNLEVSFGKPRLRVREPYISKSKSPRVLESASHRRVIVKGHWWLWVFCAYWNIIIPSTVTASYSSPMRLKRRAMSLLSGQKLVGIRVESKTGLTEFSFDLGGVLRVRRMKVDGDEDVWSLAKPDGYYVSVRGDGTFTHEKGTTPGNARVPIPLAMRSKRREDCKRPNSPRKH